MSQVQWERTPIGGETVRRRGLFGALVGVLAAGLFGRVRPAQAQDGAALLLGEENSASSETRLELKSTSSNVPAFKGVANANTENGLMPLDLPARGNIGVFGCADTGVGLWGLSDTNIGTWGVANTGVGVLGTTYPPEPGSPGPRVPEEYPPAGVFGRGNSQVGVWATSMDNIASWGISEKGIGVAGQSPHIGGWFAKGTLPADFWTKLEPAALHTTALEDDDVSACFRAEKGVAMMAEAPQGTAALLIGRIQSDMVGRGLIRKGDDMLFVPCIMVNERRSHVSVTPLGDVGSFWVELLTDKGFIVHLGKRAKTDAPVTYLVVEEIEPHEY